MSLRTSLSLACFAFASVAAAHHAYTEYDDQKSIEFEGRILRAQWINPHAHLEVEVVDAAGTRVYQVDTSPRNTLERFNVPMHTYVAGTRVKVAGWPSRRSALRLYGTNIARPGERESVIWRAQPRWGAAGWGFGVSPPPAPAPAGTRTESTLFKVWSSLYDDPEYGVRALGRSRPQLTAAAQQKLAAFDPVKQVTAVDCEMKGVPYAMGNPTPMLFIDHGNRIEVQMEENNTRRTIHLNSAAPAASQPRTLMGYSSGRWEGRTLVVETSRLSARYLDNTGVQLGSDTRIVERFTPSEDGMSLAYVVTVTDPEVFQRPHEMRRSWVHVPGERLLPYECLKRD